MTGVQTCALPISPLRLENQRVELAWTLEAATALYERFDAESTLLGKCHTGPKAEGGIALCDEPLDAETVRRILDEAMTAAGAQVSP